MLTIIHVFTCDYCGETTAEKQERMSPYMRVTFEHPRGWTWLNDKLVCPDHETVVGPRRKEKVEQ